MICHQVKLEKNDVALRLLQLEYIFEEDQASKNDSTCIVNSSSIESDNVLLDKKYTHQVNVPADIDSDDSSDSEDSSDSDDDSDSSSEEDSSSDSSEEDSSQADSDDSDVEALIGGLENIEVNDEQAHALL